MPNLPSGTVTFAFSDIEGSTALLKRVGEELYAELLATHRRLLREVFAAHHGHEIDTQGDAFFYSFVRAREAVAAAVEVQRAHGRQPWPKDASVRIRLGLHTGEPVVGNEGYTGLDVIRAARIAAISKGGQVLLSETTRAIAADSLPVGVELVALGAQRLKDIDRPEPLYALRISDVVTSEIPSAPRSAAGTGALRIQEVLAGAPAWVRELAAPIAPFANETREAIEQRVLAELKKVLATRTEQRAAGRAPASSLPPPARRPLVADEIAKLQALRERGALTEEQYHRAVDQVLGSDALEGQRDPSTPDLQ